MNQEAIRKMKLARKYQKEAFMELVPEDIRGHVETIDHEIKEIMTKCLISSGKELARAYMSETSDESAPAGTKQTNKVKKVEIG